MRRVHRKLGEIEGKLLLGTAEGLAGPSAVYRGRAGSLASSHPQRATQPTPPGTTDPCLVGFRPRQYLPMIHPVDRELKVEHRGCEPRQAESLEHG